MLRILKSINFYICVVVFAIVVAMYMPTAMIERMSEPNIEEVNPSVSVLNIIRHGDGSYSVVMQDTINDGYNEEQIDSVLISLISEI
jgi:hypothetical protein